jgi:pyruvate dehydrogenase E2 component (dihydrolipoamide acetyltransferase)
MEEGKLAKWHVKEGDAVKTGDILAEIETDKATMEFEAIDEGRIGKILVPEGAEGVKVNVPIAVLLSEGEESPKVVQSIPDAMKAIRDVLVKDAPQAPPQPPRAAPAPQSPAVVAPQSAPAPAAPRTNGTRIFASPLAKRIARQKGIDLGSLRGSGPHGRIVKADVEASHPGAEREAPPAPRPSAAAPTSPSVGAPLPKPAEVATAGMIAPLPDARLFYKEGEYEAVPLDSMRRTIARRLTSAKALIPHYYLTIDCEIGALMDVRARLNTRSPKDGPGAYKLSINDFVIKAAAMSLMKHPDVNASWSDTAILKHKHADVGIAVDLNPGLITPIITHADTRGLIDISHEARSLAERAKEKKLKPQEFEGGTFSISNLGMFGMKHFTAIINPPQSAILAIGAGEERAVAKDGKIVAVTIMSVTMGCDHRVVDGATGARFLQTFKTFIEEPASMLL